MITTYSELVKSALLDFKRNKVRTLLTSLGITIGVMSVVLLIALGVGLKNYLSQQFERLGANLIIILPGNVFSEEGGLSGNFGPGFAGGAEFDERDFVNLKNKSGADFVVPSFIKSSVIENDNNKVLGSIQAVSEDAFKVLNLVPLSGNVFDRSDVNSKSKVVVLGYTAAEKLFENPEEGVNKTLRITNQRFKVIGVLEKNGDQQVDTGAYIPYTTSFLSINPDKTFFTIYLGVKSDDRVQFVKEKTEEILLERYDSDSFSVAEQSEILSTVDQIFSVVNSILVAIGSISLLVGGIGIMNIMYATVTERTKEIGVRRAIGATEKEILDQFLTESIILSLMGGLVGLILSAIIVLAVRNFFPAAINLLSVFVALGVSSAIGIFFGVFPARRAAKLPPIEAIRYE